MRSNPRSSSSFSGRVPRYALLPEPGFAILEEIGSPAAVDVFQDYRDLALLAATPVERRGELFRQSPPRLLRRAGFPGNGTAALVQIAEGLAAWCASRGYVRSAAYFVQVGALLEPESPARLIALARVHRSLGRPTAAAYWYTKTAAVAKGTDADLYWNALTGTGKTLEDRGLYLRGARAHRAALRWARRHLPDRVAITLHNVMLALGMAAEYERADHYAAQALVAYGSGHPGVARLTHDIAIVQMRRGTYTYALPALLGTLISLQDAEERATVFGNIARAAGAVGDVNHFERAWGSAVDFIGRNPDARNNPSTLLEMARGAALLGRIRLAGATAARAREEAERRRQSAIAAEAIALSVEIEEGRAAEVA